MGLAPTGKRRLFTAHAISGLMQCSKKTFEFLKGALKNAPRSGLSKDESHGQTTFPQHRVSRQLIRVWVEKYEAGALDEDAQAADLLQEYEAKIAALERMVGRQALEKCSHAPALRTVFLCHPA